MPATTKKEGSKHRVVDAETGEPIMKDGKEVDQGGHLHKAMADTQARNINADQRANDRRA